MGAGEEEAAIEASTKVMKASGLFKGRKLIMLIIMLLHWVLSLLNYGMINIYMKYVPGTIYINFTISGLSEILAHITCGALYVKLTPRWTFFSGYAFALAGGTCLIW